MKHFLFLFAILAFPALLFAAGSQDGYQDSASQGYQGSQGNTHVLIPYGVTLIDRDSGLRNKGLSMVTIPSSVIQIGNEAFQGNVLTGLTIPDSVISIGGSAFRDNRLTSVFLGNNVTSIGGEAFGNNRLTSVNIPDSVTSIGSGAFHNPSLRSVGIGANVNIADQHDFETTSNSFPFVFDRRAYRNNNSRAGTYTYDGSKWNYSARR